VRDGHLEKRESVQLALGSERERERERTHTQKTKDPKIE